MGFSCKKKDKVVLATDEERTNDNVRLREKLLIMNEYLEKDLKTKNSSETKRLNDFKSDKFFMFVGRTCGEGQTADIVIKEENGTARSFENVHTQLGKSFTFQHIESRGILSHDDAQK